MKANKRVALFISRQVHALDVLLVFDELKAFGVKFVGELSTNVRPAKATTGFELAFARDEH